MHHPEKSWGFPTFDDNCWLEYTWRQLKKTMVLFVEIRFFALKPNTQCIGQKKLGFLHHWDIVQT